MGKNTDEQKDKIEERQEHIKPKERIKQDKERQ